MFAEVVVASSLLLKLLFLFSLSGCRPLCLPPSPLRLLWGVKKWTDGGSVLHYAGLFLCRLFAPHIAFFRPSRHTHTHNPWHAHTTPRAHRELNFGCVCASCARCKAKRCLTSPPPPPPHPQAMLEKKREKWLCDPGIHYRLCGRCCCCLFDFVRLWTAFEEIHEVLHEEWRCYFTVAWHLLWLTYHCQIKCDTLV